MKSFTLSANKDWKFYRGVPPKGHSENVSNNPHDHGLDAYDDRYDDKEWETVCLPHTVRVEKLLCSGGKNYQGECWYRKRFTVKKEWEDKELFFEFGGAMQRLDAWLDGKALSSATCGFLPVRLSVSGLKEGEHLLALKSDNSDMPDVPPGKPQGALDFCYFGGLYRDAKFSVRNKLRFTDAVHEGRAAAGGLFARAFLPDGKGGDAQIRVRATVVNHESADAEITLKLLLDGAEACEKSASVQAGQEIDLDNTFVVKNPALWSPDSPNVYKLTARLYKGDELLEEKEENLGIRTTEFKNDGFYLNGERLFLNGTNRHQEFPYVGFAIPDAMQKRDLRLIKDTGFNCIRTAHYPMSESFMNYCDELGILCIVPTPGWQIHPASVLFDERSYENTRRIVRMNRNHPSMLLYEPILNETDYPEYFAEEQANIVMEECGDAPAWFACDAHSRLADRFPVNYRHGNAIINKPVVVREYNDNWIEQYGPKKTIKRVRRGERTDYYPGGEVPMIKNATERFECYASLRRDERLCGGCIWCAFDNNRGYELNEGAWGIFDFLRIPKFSYYMYDAQQDIKKAGAKCFIANYRKESSPEDVTVFANTEEVRLSLNGRVIGTKKVVREEGINSPVVFENVPFEKGVLTAEAVERGAVLKSYSVTTPEKPVAVRLTAKNFGVEGWKADGSDLMLVHAEIVDKNGTVVPDAEPVVRFFLQGDAEIVGAKEKRVQADRVQAEAGVTGVVLRAGRSAGKIVLSAEAEGLPSSEITLEISPDDTEYLGGREYEPTVTEPEYPCDRNEFFSEAESVKQSHSDRWDVGLLKPACASSYKEGFGPEQANGKEIYAPWTAADETLPQWWQVDLQGECEVTGVAISWEKDWVWYDFDVLVSTDGKEWTKCHHGYASGQTTKPERFSSPVKAGYLRIAINALRGEGAAAIYHVAVYGNKISG
ncbi:MAG: glycoside hydrolase family 2 TIM barrel-domain containing protein [Candidatus Neoclostridium sp.]